jgi:hypothetical protein
MCGEFWWLAGSVHDLDSPLGTLFEGAAEASTAIVRDDALLAPARARVRESFQVGGATVPRACQAYLDVP